MTASPADSAETRAPATHWRSVVGIVAWATYFVSLVIVYLTAFHRHSLACQSAAAWGLAISLSIALLTFPAAVAQFGPGLRESSPRQPRAMSLFLGVMLLVVAPMAVIWVAINLTLADQATGAWVLTLPASTAPIASFIGSRSDGRRAIRAGGETIATIVESGLAPFILADVPVEAPVEPVEEPKLPVPKEAATPILLLRPRGLLSYDCASRLGGRSLAVALDSGFWRAAMDALAAQSTEQGGVALTTRINDVVLILGAVFPSQVHASPVRCEFSTADVERVRRALDAVADELGIGDGDVRVTWVHTHPQLGVFLSSTDRSTARDWRELDPDFTPIVIDASKKKLADQIGVYDAVGEQILPMRVVDGLVDDAATVRLKQEILDAYRTDGLPKPLVLISGSAG